MSPNPSKADVIETQLKLTKEIADTKVDTIKWVAGMLFVQMIAIMGVFLTAFKLFMPM